MILRLIGASDLQLLVVDAATRLLLVAAGLLVVDAATRLLLVAAGLLVGWAACLSLGSPEWKCNQGQSSGLIEVYSIQAL